METLWERLNLKYGNRGKLIDSILADISRAPKGDGKCTMLLIKTVERAHRDLTRMGDTCEMYNGTILSLIEKKLPDEMRFEWVKIVSENREEGSAEKFQKMLKLMQRWRNMIEYDQESIRKVSEKRGLVHHTSLMRGKSKCWIHTELAEHPVWRCKTFQMKPLDERIALTIENNGCHACLETDCPGVTQPEKCQRRFKCPVKGCGKPHNKLLHQ